VTRTQRQRAVWARCVTAATLTLVLTACAQATAQPKFLTDSFAGPDGLIAAEGDPSGEDSPWEMTSGSLFRQNGAGWSGVPDAGGSQGHTGSAVFRMVSKQRDFSDADITAVIRVDDLVTTNRTPSQDFDGAHVWVRYESDRQLYAVSVDRRDSTMIIKKKCAGGDSNGGTYYDLSAQRPDSPIPFGQWQHVRVAVRDEPDGSVSIRADRDGLSLDAVDTGIGCPPLRGDGAVGIRGDNAELRFASIIVEPAQPFSS
jgi:hypothetical protein